jgi:hypothetical protein
LGKKEQTDSEDRNRTSIESREKGGQSQKSDRVRQRDIQRVRITWKRSNRLREEREREREANEGNEETEHKV